MFLKPSFYYLTWDSSFIDLLVRNTFILDLWLYDRNNSIVLINKCTPKNRHFTKWLHFRNNNFLTCALTKKSTLVCCWITSDLIWWKVTKYWGKKCWLTAFLDLWIFNGMKKIIWVQLRQHSNTSLDTA